METFTVAELAERIRDPREDAKGVVDRLRNWTKEGLLQTSGDKHPGTGRKRVYSRKALIDAMILQHLTSVIGIPAVRTKEFASLFKMIRDASGLALEHYAVIKLFERKPVVCELMRSEDVAKTVGSDADAMIVFSMDAIFGRIDKGR